MDHPQTPRILAPHLSTFQHRIVRVLGEVVQLRGDTAVIDAGGHVDVILNRVRVIFYLTILHAMAPTKPQHEMRVLMQIVMIGLASRCRPRGRGDWQGGWQSSDQGAGCYGFWNEYR